MLAASDLLRTAAVALFVAGRVVLGCDVVDVIDHLISREMRLQAFEDVLNARE